MKSKSLGGVRDHRAEGGEFKERPKESSLHLEETRLVIGGEEQKVSRQQRIARPGKKGGQSKGVDGYGDWMHLSDHRNEKNRG